MKTKKHLKNTKNFGMGLKIELRAHMMAHSNMIKILQKLNLTN